MDKILDKLRFLWSKTNRFHRIIFIFVIIELKLVPGGQLGFRCNDPALSYAFTGDTISWKWLMAVTILLPLVVMLLVERKYHNEDKQRPKKRALRWYKEYLFGFLLNLTVVQLLKIIVGSPRPHFFDTCKPKEALTCSESEYISSYTCTKATWVNQSDRSFPSGHTSLALHAGLFIATHFLCKNFECRKKSSQGEIKYEEKVPESQHKVPESGNISDVTIANIHNQPNKANAIRT